VANGRVAFMYPGHNTRFGKRLNQFNFLLVKKIYHFILFCTLSAFSLNLFAQKQLNTEVLVIGGGTGRTAAGLQSTRMKVNTIITEPTTRLGGMFSAAGILAFESTSRLQPCVMLTGQAAGTLAALCIKQQKNAAQVSVREVQKQLLNNKAYIMPYFDVKPAHPFFTAIQKIGATGILKGTGQSNAWANRTWFYPDSTIEATTFLKDFKEYKPLIFESKNKWITVNDLFEIIASQQSLGNNEAVEMKARLQKSWMVAGLKELDLNRNIKRFEAAVMIDKWIKPFDVGLVDHRGVFKN